MYPQVLFKNRKPDQITAIDQYRDNGGYKALADALEHKTPKEVRQILLDADLGGRGGAAFPMGKKLATIPEDAPFPRYIVCNADEMEPGTFKDRVLLYSDPHQLIEGLLLTGFAAQAQHGVIFIRPEYENAARILEREIELARRFWFVGNNILNSGFDFDITVHRSGGRYICGEGSALLNALQGKRANPKRPPPYPTVKGLWECPTDLQNVETLCCVPHIIENGAQWFRSLALTPESSGTKIFSVSGKVNQPGCYELPMGVKLSEIIETHAGGMLNGAEFKACLPGGASTRFMPKSLYDIQMDFNSLRKEGYRLGTAALMVFDQHTCLVDVTLNLIEFFVRESCGWCTPCREGLPYVRDILWRIENGQGRMEHIEKLKTMCRHLNHAYCAFAPGAASPVESLLTVFEDEVKAHINEGHCPLSTD